MESLLSLFSLKILKDKGMVKYDYATPALIKYLKIPPSHRKPKEISILKHFTNKVDFFTSAHTENSDIIHYQSCQSMKYEYFPKGEIVFKYGEIGKTFYIILEGQVDVQIKTQVENCEIFTSVAVLSTGNSFGDLALLKDHPRNATVTCLTDCHFAVLVKEDYLRILGKIADKKISDFVEFLKEIPIFRSWSKKNLESLFYFFKPVMFNRKNSVYCVGSEPTHVYIVKNGEFEISKKKSLSGENKKVDMRVAILSKGEMFGDRECLEDIPREYNCSCYSAKGELYAITSKDFMLKIKTEDSIAMINIRNKAKSALRHQRSKVFDEIFTPRKQIYRKITIYDKEEKPFNRAFPLLGKEKNSAFKDKPIEMATFDIDIIRDKASPEKNLKYKRNLKTPDNHSHRGNLDKVFRSKSSIKSIKKTKQTNLFSL
ncbi:hypothetical protein SteCoe_23015 [Stentor coeruleus]|uniref:Cyclic nucleotide-binding domain-containing protein n=1 Tax=Stentor coeruleus TaxID=5963 RepID=A0A1R2BKV4_9CILI|nr:hypothetical protein SteCoe_23015 [Stentor coeruleus]